MPILNYTTKVSIERSASVIQGRLAKAKAQAILSEYDPHGVMCAMSFRILTPHGPVFFRLPVQTEGVYKAICKDKSIPQRSKTKEQAARIAWRILKDWVEIQLALIEVEMATLLEVFLPYAQNANGETVYQTLEKNNFNMLTHEKG